MCYLIVVQNKTAHIIYVRLESVSNAVLTLTLRQLRFFSSSKTVIGIKVRENFIYKTLFLAP